MKTFKYKGAIYTRAGVYDFDVDKAQELLETMENSLEELNRMFHKVGGLTLKRWQSYPYGNIVSLLSEKSGHGRQIFTIDDLIAEVDKAQRGTDDDGDVG
jgi:hypothetical protein